MTVEGSYETLSILEADTVPLGDDGLQWVPVRRRLGIGAFGINAYRADRAGDTVVEDHVESPGQEELYLVVRGRAQFKVDGDPVEVGEGTGIFVRRPDLRRHAVAVEDDTVVLAIGGWRDQPYHSLPWEPIYLAQGAMREGDWARAAETLHREAGEHRDTAIIRFRLAYCHARLGENDEAVAELTRAIEIRPELRDRAQNEEAFAALRRHEDWPA